MGQKAERSYGDEQVTMSETYVKRREHTSDPDAARIWRYLRFKACVSVTGVATLAAVVALPRTTHAQDEQPLDKIALAKAFMAEYIKRADSYDPALSMMFAEKADLRFKRFSDTEDVRDVDLHGQFWRNMYTKTVPKMQAAGDREIFFNITYEETDDGVVIKGMRRQVRQNFVGPFMFLIHPDENGTWRIFEYERQARAPSQNVFINLAVGVAVNKPIDWTFTTIQAWSDHPRRVELASGWMKRLAESNPLVRMAKSTAGVTTPEESARLWVYPATVPLEPLQGRLDIATKLVSKDLEGSEPLGPAESMQLEDVSALRRRYKTTLLWGNDKKMPAVRELVIAQRGDMVFLLDMICPIADPGTDLLEAEDDFQLIRESLWIDTTPIP